MPRRLALLLLIVASSACALRPLPPPRPAECAISDPASLWHCVGRPDARDEESGFAGTMRVVWGDIVQRYKNQRPSLSCDREPRAGYTRIELNVEATPPLRAFFAPGDPSKPIVFVLHGLFDSNADLYVMRAADALMRQHYGVVIPDLRWHGCLLADEWLSTLDLEEARDLVAWGQRIRRDHPNRSIGIVGFSMGGLNAIAALSQPEAAEVFDAGAIAVSPPAELSSLIAHLNEPASLRREGRNALFHFSFRTHLHARMKALHLDDRRAPFAAYLTYLLAHWPTGTPPSSIDAFIAAAEPSTRLTTIRRPLLIITAPDDPVLGEASSRTLVAAANGLPYVNVLTTADGGHIGHLGRYAQWLADTFDRFFTNAPLTKPRA
jgi:predicted alpha/beta-fold hydrolase